MVIERAFKKIKGIMPYSTAGSEREGAIIYKGGTSFHAGEELPKRENWKGHERSVSKTD